MGYEVKNLTDLEALTGGKPKFITLTAAVPTYTMQPNDQCITIYSSADDAAGILYLPFMADAAGKYYYINAPTGAAAGDISIYTSEGTAAEFTTYGDLDADDDWVILYCDGRKWRMFMNSGTF
jgi:hypothetical protein